MKRRKMAAGEIWLLDVTTYKKIKEQEQQAKERSLEELRAVRYRRFALRLRSHLSVRFGEDAVYEHLNTSAITSLLKSSDL